MNRSDLLREFTRGFDDVDAERALEVLELSAEERRYITTGVSALPEPVRAACETVLADWSVLDPSARVAVLLVLANALAGAVDRELEVGEHS